jgi:hypothetical protein
MIGREGGREEKKRGGRGEDEKRRRWRETRRKEMRKERKKGREDLRPLRDLGRFLRTNSTNHKPDQ